MTQIQALGAIFAAATLLHGAPMYVKEAHSGFLFKHKSQRRKRKENRNSKKK